MDKILKNAIVTISASSVLGGFGGFRAYNFFRSLMEEDVQDEEIIQPIPRRGGKFLFPLAGVLLAWFYAWIARVATGETLFSMDVLTIRGPVTLAVGDLLVLSGLVLGFLVKIFIKRKKTGIIILAILMVGMLIFLTATARET